MDVFLAGVPDSRVKISEEEPVISCFPTVMHFALVSLIYPVVNAVMPPFFAAVGLGDSLCALTPICGDKCRSGEEKGNKIQSHGQQGTTFPSGLHRPWFERLVPTTDPSSWKQQVDDAVHQRNTVQVSDGENTGDNDALLPSLEFDRLKLNLLRHGKNAALPITTHVSLV